MCLPDPKIESKYGPSCVRISTKTNTKSSYPILSQLPKLLWLNDNSNSLGTAAESSLMRTRIYLYPQTSGFTLRISIIKYCILIILIEFLILRSKIVQRGAKFLLEDEFNADTAYYRAVKDIGCLGNTVIGQMGGCIPF